MAATAQGYVIEDMPDGRTVVVTDQWTSETEAAIHRPDVDGVWLNYARGYREPNLSFLGAWPIKRLLLIDRSINDLAPIGRLGQTLEHLSFQAAPDASIDLAMLPNLRSLAAYWDEVRETLYAPEYLSELTVFDYDELDLAPLTVQPSLQLIQLKVARTLETLDGMADFPTLTTLKIAAAPKLSELDALPTSRATLRELDLEQCRGIYDIDAIGTLAELRFLGLGDCGPISSLGAIAELVLLERLYAWGTTRVEDRDLSPLLRLSRLREIRMRDRHEYQPSLGAIKEQLGIA